MTKSYFPEESTTFARNIELLRGHRVAVLGHRRPDGDCIGSQVALTRVLNATGIETLAVNIDPVPRTLKAFVGDTPFFLAADFARGRISRRLGRLRRPCSGGGLRS